MTGRAYQATRAAALLDRGGMVYNAKAYGAVGDTRQSAADVSVTSGSPIVMSASIAFTQADVGKAIRVGDAANSITRLTGTILSVQSATQATASANASATLSSRVMEVGTDDTAAIQAAIDAPGGEGAVCYLPPGAYYITSTLTLRKSTQLIGCGSGSSNSSIPTLDGLTVIWANRLTTTSAIKWPDGSEGASARGIRLYCPGPNQNPTTGSKGFDLGNGAGKAYIEGCLVQGAYYGIYGTAISGVSLRDSYTDNAMIAGLYISGGSNLIVVACGFGNTFGNFAAGAGNIVLTGGVRNCAFYIQEIDEHFNSSSTSGSVVFDNCTDVTFCANSVFVPNGNSGNGILIGASSARITIINTKVQPFSSAVPGQTIKIASGATDIRLIGVSTNPNGGGDIDDQGTRTQYVGCNINGVLKTSLPVVATGSLAAASAAMNGCIVIEDGGAGDHNLVIYSGGQRHRLDGGANV